MCSLSSENAHTCKILHLLQKQNLAVMSRDEIDCELSPFSLTKCVTTSSEKGEQLLKSISSTSTASSLLALEGPPAVDAGCYGNLEGQLQVSFASRMLGAKGGSLEGSASRVPAAPGARHQSKFPRLRPASPASPFPWHPQNTPHSPAIETRRPWNPSYIFSRPGSSRLLPTR